MQDLITQVKALERLPIAQTINTRMLEFAAFAQKDNNEWFSELCFCILTANSKQKTGAKIQALLGAQGFLTLSQEDLASTIQGNKHRFHNNKARYIVQAREFHNIKDILAQKTELEARKWLVENIYGLGLKEASHFLRNTGSQNLAILDRHILALLSENNIIGRLKTPTPKNYLAIELKFVDLAKELNMSPAKLDLYLWYMKTGEVLK